MAFVAAVGTVLGYGLIASLLRSRPSRRRRAARKMPWWAWLVELAAAALAALALLGLVDLLAHHRSRELQPAQGFGLRPPANAFGHLAAGASATVGWLPVAVGAALSLGALLGYQLLARWRSAKLAPVEKLSTGRGSLDRRRREAVAALDLSLEALWAEPDPRRAVIAAYARMESWLAHVGMGRRSSEAPFEHLGRVMSWLGAPGAVGAALAGLFERAKFDWRPCGQEMKEEALGALVRLRDELSGLGARV